MLWAEPRSGARCTVAHSRQFPTCRRGGRFLGWIVNNPIAHGTRTISHFVLDEAPAKLLGLVQKIPAQPPVHWQMVLPGLLLLLALLAFLFANLFSSS